MRQGLLSEPQASSGPAAMLLAVSRSPSSIPRRSPCPVRCHLPLAFLNHIHLSKPQKHPRLHPLPKRCHLPLASLDHIHLSKPQKTSPTASTSQNLKNTPNYIHSRSNATFLWRPSTTSPLTKPQTYPRLLPMLRADVKKISRTDMRLRHSLSLAFHKKIKCIILIDKRIKTSAAVYGKYHTKGGFYHGIQTFRKHDLSSS